MRELQYILGSAVTCAIPWYFWWWARLHLGSWSQSHIKIAWLKPRSNCANEAAKTDPEESRICSFMSYKENRAKGWSGNGEESSTQCKFFFLSMRIFIENLLQEWRDIESMNDDNMRIRDEIDVMRSKYSALKKFAIEKKILIPAELENIWILWFFLLILISN